MGYSLGSQVIYSLEGVEQTTVLLYLCVDQSQLTAHLTSTFRYIYQSSLSTSLDGEQVMAAVCVIRILCDSVLNFVRINHRKPFALIY